MQAVITGYSLNKMGKYYQAAESGDYKVSRLQRLNRNVNDYIVIVTQSNTKIKTIMRDLNF